MGLLSVDIEESSLSEDEEMNNEDDEDLYLQKFHDPFTTKGW